MNYKYIYMFFLLLAWKTGNAMEPIKPQDDNAKFYESIRKNDLIGIQYFYGVVKRNLNSDFEDPLVYSARVGAKSSLNFLLHNYYMGENFTQFRNQAFLSSSFKGDIEGIKALMRAGVDKDYSADGTVNALWASIEGGHPEVFKYLLSQGVNYNFINKKGENLLFPAVLLGDLGIIQILLDLGVSPKIVVKDGVQEKNLKDYAYYRWRNNPDHLKVIIEMIQPH